MWRKEKVEARRKKALEEKSRKWEEAHWEWVRQQKEERARARRRAMEAAQMAAEWAAEQTAASNKYGIGANWKPPAEWWTAQSAEAMKKQGVPADWALRMALFQMKKKEGQGVGGAEGPREKGNEGKKGQVAE